MSSPENWIKSDVWICLSPQNIETVECLIRICGEGPHLTCLTEFNWRQSFEKENFSKQDGYYRQIFLMLWHVIWIKHNQSSIFFYLGHIKLIIWFSGPCASIQTVLHGQFYCHFHKIKIRTAELHYSTCSRKKIVIGFNFRLIRSISGTKSQNNNIVEKWRLTSLKYVYWLFLQLAEQSR
jgi:hypothetical protein